MRAMSATGACSSLVLVRKSSAGCGASSAKLAVPHADRRGFDLVCGISLRPCRHRVSSAQCRP